MRVAARCRTARAALALVAAAIAAQTAAQERAPSPSAWLCRGNEPGWALTIEGPRARLQRLGQQAESLGGELQRAEWAQPPTVVWRGRAGDGEVVAVVTRERCADTMADQRFAWRGLLSLPGEGPLVGCCNALAGDSSAPPRQGWSRYLPDLLPAIEACRAQAAPGSVVLSAWPMNHGIGGSRWRSPSGEARDCLAELTGTRVDSWWPARDDGKGDGDPIFVPTGSWGVTNPACVRVEPVERAGEIVGFLYSGTCR